MPRRRGSALLGVFAIVVAAALLAATLLGVTRNSVFHASASADAAEARTLAHAAVAVVLREFESERDAMLDGREPEIAESFTLWELPDGRRAVARLLTANGDRRIVSENRLLDANHASAEALASLKLVPEDLARRIVNAREEAPFLSLADLLAVEGITEERLFGERAGLIDALERDSDRRELGLPAAASTQRDGDAPAHLAEALTVFGFEPDVMSGLSGEPGDRGTKRIDLAREWSDDLRAPIERRYGDDIARAAERLLSDPDRRIESEADIVRLLIELGVPTDRWREVLDIFTATPGAFRTDRVDVNRAPPAILRTLPGVTEETAERIVSERATLDDRARASPAWLVEREIVSRPSFAAIAPRVTTRSFQWRVRLEVGIEQPPERDSAAAVPGRSARSGDLAELELADRRLFELVVDAAAPRARAAMLRDITNLAPALRLRRSAERADGAAGLAGLPPAPEADPDRNADAPPGPNARDRRVGSRAARWAEERDARDPFSDRAARFGMDDPPGDETTRSPADIANTRPASSATPQEDPAADNRSDPPDPRLGRWTAPAR